MTSLFEDAQEGPHLSEAGQDISAFAAPEITPEEFAEHTANMFANALAATKMFGVVEVKAGVGQIHVMGRVKKDRERRFAKDVVYPVLLSMQKDEDCNGFVGKQFILRSETGDPDEDMKYAWVFSFASNDLKRSASDICRSFESVVPKMEVTEGPLMGPGTPQSGGIKSGKRGAAPIT